MIGADIETFPITHLNPSPSVVCVSAWSEGGGPRGVFSLTESGGPRLIRELFEGESVWHGGWFDVAALGRNDSALWPLIFDAYDKGRIHDTAIREMLHNLATCGDPEGQGDGVPSLADLARERCGIDISKSKLEDSWRTRFGELYGLAAKDYPKAAYDYALLDAKLAYKIAQHQPDFECEWLHVAAAFCYYLKTAEGLDVDRKLKRKLQKKVELELDPSNLPLVFQKHHAKGCKKGPDCRCLGFVTPAKPALPYARGVKDHSAECPRTPDCPCPPKLKKPVAEKANTGTVIRPWVVKVCEENQVKVAMTDPSERFPTGQVKVDKETLEDLSGYCPTIKQYAAREKLIKLRTSYFPGLEWPFGSGRTAFRIFPGYEPLKKTGRGSSRGVTRRSKDKALYPSVNIQQADPRIRAIYKPRPGWVFLVGDYSAIDLCCLAQTVFNLFGKSELLDQINNGIDPHTIMAAEIGRNEKAYRKKLGGLSLEDAYKVIVEAREAGEEWAEELRALAKKVGLGYPGGMGIETMRKTCAKEGLKITRQAARRYKRMWQRLYPTSARYLRWITTQKDKSGEWLCYTSILGMHRAKCSYTEAANGKALQTPAAEGKKIADFLITRACYDPTRGDVLLGSKPVIDMHDEFVVATRNDSAKRLDRKARRFGELMVDGMCKVLKNVKPKVKPLITTRWVKEARQVLNDAGLIVPFVWEGDK